MTQPTAALALVLTLAAGCTASTKVDIGEGTAPPPGLLGASLIDYAGTWDGYAEAFTWNDGSDRIRIMLDANGVGTIRLGNAPDFPPPDPDRAYPAIRENVHPMADLPLLIADSDQAAPRENDVDLLVGVPVFGYRVATVERRMSHRESGRRQPGHAGKAARLAPAGESLHRGIGDAEALHQPRILPGMIRRS